MAGRKQHFIPQSFLKGFVIPDGNDKLWMFRKGSTEPIAVGRKDTAAQRDFNSEPSTGGMPTLDDNITQYEGSSFAQKLRLLRKLDPGDKVNSIDVAEVLTHLIVRNSHTRSIMREGIFQMLEAFTGPDPGIDVITRLSSNKGGTEVRQAIEGVISDNNLEELTGFHQHTLFKMGHFLLRERFPSLMPQMKNDIDVFINAMQERTPEFARSGHQKALAKSHTPESRISYLSKFSWMVENSPSEGVILPDCVALGLNDSNVWIPVILGDPSVFKAIIAPLTRDKFLVGRLDFKEELDLKNFNQWASAASFDFFWSHRSGDDLSQISSNIGTGSKSILQDLVATSVAGIESDSSDFEEEAEHSDNQHFKLEARSFGYEISFTNADKETANKISVQVNYIVGKFSEIFHIDRLDGVTFASNYKQALIDLDRGFESARQLKPINIEYGVGVAMAPCVLRNGIIKWRVVAQDWIGHSLISGVGQSRSQAVGIIWEMLAKVASGQLFDDAFPKAMLKPLSDEYETTLYGYLSNVFAAYFSSRLSAAFHQEETGSMADMLEMALRQTCELIPASRYSYRFHGNFSEFFGSAIEKLSEVLLMSAQILGHLDGLDKKLPLTSKLSYALMEFELLEWFELFHSDIEDLFGSAGRWSSINQFLILNRHMERLLWSFGIVPERTANCGMHVHVPLYSDAEHLMEEK
ncbi:DUF4238 domain-containing protein [Paremcibacter congregatus]|uniref:DUF4238 domain-containing protein n=1 Tax=Paremcibacter congregatus TaxID=2043170 RepID=UPI003A8E1910